MPYRLTKIKRLLEMENSLEGQIRRRIGITQNKSRTLSTNTNSATRNKRKGLLSFGNVKLVKRYWGRNQINTVSH